MTPGEELLVGLAVKSTILILLAWAAAGLLRKASAALRHLVWAAALGGLALLPALNALLPAWRAPVAPPASSGTAVSVVQVTTGDASQPLRVGQLAWALWGGGFLAAAIRLGIGLRRAARIVRNARRAEVWGTEVWVSPEAATPGVYGFWRPRVILPEQAVGWGAARLRLVLEHEGMHLRRQDSRTQILAEWVCALYWPNPLVWRAAARLRREAEQACDDGVLAQGEDPAHYAGELVAIVRSLRAAGKQPEGGFVMECGSELERRITALLQGGSSRRRLTAPALVAGCLLALGVAAPLAALRGAAVQGGGIEGVVRDSSGAVVEGARVKAALAGGDQVEFAQTDSAGRFALRPLPEGVYVVTVAKPGFALSRLEGIVVKQEAPARIEVVLNLGMVVERLEVRGESSQAPAPPPAGTERIRVGGKVQAPKLVAMVKPVYPPDCKAEGVEGTVALRAVIGRDGAMLDLKPMNRLVDQRLVQAALEAVRQWRYQPTFLNRRPVEVVSEIEVNFVLPR